MEEEEEEEVVVMVVMVVVGGGVHRPESETSKREVGGEVKRNRKVDTRDGARRGRA